MQQFTDKLHRSFDPMAVPGLSNEARNAVNAAFDAMSTWRTETVNNNEKNLEQVIEKMAAAARALGWPEQIVDATRSQMQSVGGADQISEPVSHAVQAEVAARLWLGGRLAGRG
jgi:hypothetical protein